MLQVTPEQRRALRARAHALDPVVIISQNGLSENVLKEIDSNLTAHELIKNRVFSDERATREDYLSQICEKLGAAPVQHIGKLLVLWRPSAEKAATPIKPVRKPYRKPLSKRQLQGHTPR